MLSTVGANDPRRPRSGRNSTIPGTPSREPASPTKASGMHPIAEPTAMASKAFGKPRAGTSSAPVSRTSRPIARSPHNTARSNPENRRRSSGTGRIPQAGASRSRRRASRSVTVANVSLRRGPQAVADRRARYRTTGLARPFSSAGPTSSNPIPSSETSGTVSSLANTSPGPAFAAMRAAMFTVRPK